MIGILLLFTISLPLDSFTRLLTVVGFTPARLIITFAFMFVIGLASGYLFRASIGRDLSVFQVTSLIEHLETYWATAETNVKPEVGKLAEELKKLLAKI